jgi:hypothetical protein
MVRESTEPTVLSNGNESGSAPPAHAVDRAHHLLGANGSAHEAEDHSVNLGADPGEDHEALLATLGLSPNGEPLEAAEPGNEALRRENHELREIIAELKQQLAQQGESGHSAVTEKQKEFDALLEEKTEIIRALHQKLQESPSRASSSSGGQNEEELLALSEELDRERCQLQQEHRQLEDERKQLQEDEELMTKQMREMEVQMARERADFARQRSELTRIYEEIRREMENIERNGLLNQRLGQLRQRLHESSAGVSAPSRSGSNPVFPAARPERPAVAQPVDPASTKRRDGLIGRFFG